MLDTLRTAFLIPFVVGSILTGLLAYARSASARAAFATLVAGAAFAAGSRKLAPWPELPPHVAVDWITWIAVGTAVVGAWSAVLRIPIWARAVVLAALAGGIAWVLLEPLVPHALSEAAAPLTMAGTTLVLVVMASPAAIVEPRTGPLPRLPIVIASVASVFVVGSSSTRMAEFASVLFGTLLGVWTAVLVSERRRPHVSLSPFPALVLGAVLVSAWGYGSLDPLHGGLVAASGLCGLIAPRGSWRATILRIAVAALLAGLAIALAYGAAADRWRGLL